MRNSFLLKFCSDYKDADKTLCEDIIYTKLAVAQKDSKLCDKIISQSEKYNCTSALEALRQSWP